jgi:hypothetical protein
MTQRREIRHAGYAGLVALAARAQQPSMPVIGHLDSARTKGTVSDFRKGP